MNRNCRLRESCPWMKLTMNVSEIFAVDVRVNLSCRYVGVSKHFLDRSEICAPFEQMRGKRMTKRVRRNAFRDSRLQDILAKNFPRAHPRQRLSSGVQKKNSLPFTVLDSRPQLACINRDRTNGTATDRHDTLLSALSENANEMLVHQHVAHTD